MRQPVKSRRTKMTWEVTASGWRQRRLRSMGTDSRKEEDESVPWHQPAFSWKELSAHFSWRRSLFIS